MYVVFWRFIQAFKLWSVIELGQDLYSLHVYSRLQADVAPSGAISTHRVLWINLWISVNERVHTAKFSYPIICASVKKSAQ